jgi:hypothetical protein
MVRDQSVLTHLHIIAKMQLELIDRRLAVRSGMCVRVSDGRVIFVLIGMYDMFLWWRVALQLKLLKWHRLF